MTIQTPIAEVTLPIHNLDTYQTGKVWQTLWHTDQLAPDAAINAIKPLGGAALTVGDHLSHSGITGTITAIHANDTVWVITIVPEP